MAQRIKIKVRVKGVNKVFRKLSEAEKRRILPALERGIHKAGYIIERNAKKLAPVDTGRLRKSIRTVTGKMRASVVTGVKYAAYQEFGTSRAKAHPFMRPAMRTSVRRIEATIASEIQKAIKTVYKY